jgi:hypothetical protein
MRPSHFNGSVIPHLAVFPLPVFGAKRTDGALLTLVHYGPKARPQLSQPSEDFVLAPAISNPLTSGKERDRLRLDQEPHLTSVLFVSFHYLLLVFRNRGDAG